MRIAKFIGWRKLGFAITLTVISTIALFFIAEDANFDQWADFQKWIYGSYAATNVGEYFGKRFGLDKKIIEDEKD